MVSGVKELELPAQKPDLKHNGPGSVPDLTNALGAE